MNFILKLSKLCNLRCTYCYEYDSLADRERMPLAGLEFFLRHLAEALEAMPSAPRVRFILHGGEPLLLPRAYLAAVCGAMEHHLGQRGLLHDIALQTNLTRLDDDAIALLRSHRISLGVSFDVLGEQRVDAGGCSADHRVVGNMQRLVDDGLGFGGIAVMHAHNVDAVRHIHAFYQELGVSMRLLPIFARHEPDARTAPLMLTAERVVAALCELADHLLDHPDPIPVRPLEEWMRAAARTVHGVRGPAHDPMRDGEWAVIVDTNGDVYNHGDAYTAEGWYGNLFQQTWAEIAAGPARRRMHRRRMARAVTCEGCRFDGRCNRLPVIEAYQSQQLEDAHGTPRCAVARPVLEHIHGRMRRNPALADRWHFGRRRRGPRLERRAPELAGPLPGR